MQEPSCRQYDNFELSIDPDPTNGWDFPVHVDSPAGETHAVMHFPFSELELDNQIIKLENAMLRSNPGRKARLASPPDEEVALKFGEKLFEALMTGSVRALFETSLARAQEKDKGLRLKLRVNTSRLAALPWEFLYRPSRHDYLCMSTDTPLVRYMELEQPIRPLMVVPPLRILGMVALPSGYDELDVEREKKNLQKALAQLSAKKMVELVWLPDQTYSGLQDALRHGPWHVFHFIGHGGFSPIRDEGEVIFATSEGQEHPIRATDLGRVLANHRSMRLVVLNSCEGARGGSTDLFSSTASVLVGHGIPAVLAMQYEISDPVAIQLARTFYTSLAEAYPVDAALTEARVDIGGNFSNSLEWATPVLYMRSPDGVLFDLQAPAEASIEEENARKEAARLEQARLEQERLEQEQAAQSRLASEKAEKERKARRDRLYLQGQGLYNSGDYAEVLPYLEEALTVAPDDPEVQALLDSARAKLAEQQAEQQRLEQARLASEKAEQERLERQKAEKAEQQRLEHQKAERDRLYKAGQQEFAANHFIAAIDFLEKALSAAPDDPEVKRLLTRARTKLTAQMKADSERLQRERAEIEQRKQAERQRLELEKQVSELYEQGKQQYNVCNYRAALELFQQASQLNPNYQDLAALIGSAQKKLEESERKTGQEALVAELKKIEQGNRQSQEALLAELTQAEKAKNWDAAITAGTKLLKLKSIPPELKKRVATAYCQRGLAYLDKAPDKPAPHFLDIKQYDNWTKALSDFDNALKLNPDYGAAYFGRGKANFRMAQSHVFIKKREPLIQPQAQSSAQPAHLLQTPTVRPGSFSLLNDWQFDAQKYEETKKQYRAVVADLDRFLALVPNHAEAYFLRGRSYYVIGDEKQAKSDFRQAYRLGYKDAGEWLSFWDKLKS
ncbi:MAG TPA: CHAT domain-containing protein [Chloroflexia bacterium]|nr:CHAT domain-containing protein [Chloroflexia bacterium]